MKRLRGCLILVVVLSVVSAAAIGLRYWDRYRYDAKVPLGTWYGTFSSTGGIRGAILAVVERKDVGTGVDSTYNGKGNSVTFTGDVRICLATQTAQRFKLDGYTDISGPGFAFELTTISGPASGLLFVDGLHGERWRQTLVMSGRLAPFAPVGVAPAATDGSHVITTTLTAGDEMRYLNACKGLGAP